MTDFEHFEGFIVRFVGTADSPEWVASDVCAVLGLSNVSDALIDFEDYQKGIANVYTPGGLQKMLTVTEAGLYALVFKSRKDNAKRFQKWVISEVLPAIRKYGYYAQSSGRHLPPALEERKARLEIIDLGMELLSQLGGIDERTELQLKDLVRDIVLADKLERPALSSAEPERLEYPISDRLIDLGYGVQNGSILKSIGQIASNLYKARYGTRPPQREQYVDGTTRMVRVYSKDDLDIVDQAIRQKLGEPPN
jgi:prophage antirepressor-like protein